MWCSECLLSTVSVSNTSLIPLCLSLSLTLTQCVWTADPFSPLAFFCWLPPLTSIPHIYKATWSVCPALFPLLSLFPTANFPPLHSHSHTTKVSCHSICVPMNELHPASNRPSLWPKNLLCVDQHMVCLHCLLACLPSYYSYTLLWLSGTATTTTTTTLEWVLGC